MRLPLLIHPLSAVALLLLLPPLFSSTTACRVVSVDSAALPFVSGDYELAGWRSQGAGAEENGEQAFFSHNGRPVYLHVSTSTDEPRRYLYSIQVCVYIGQACHSNFHRLTEA